MEATGARYCQSCNCPLLQGGAQNLCLRCQQPTCQHTGLAPYASQLKRGQMVACPDCRQEVVPILCPYSNCAIVFFANYGFRMGEVCQCINCGGRFQQAVCFCGNCINAQVGLGGYAMIEGDSKVNCASCEVSFYYTTCNLCLRTNYSKDLVRQGQSVRCGSCKASYIKLSCPQCSKPTINLTFQPGKQYACPRPGCQALFEYTWCPSCMGCNTSINSPANEYLKQCKYAGCGKAYFHLVCTGCSESLYMDNIARGCEYSERCARCKKSYKIVYCSTCGQIHLNEEKCEILENQLKLLGFLGVAQKPAASRNSTSLFTNLEPLVLQASSNPSLPGSAELFRPSLFSNSGGITDSRGGSLFSVPSPAQVSVLFGAPKNNQNPVAPKPSNGSGEVPKPSASTQQPDPTCKVCMQRHICMVNMKCKHLAICETCYESMKKKEVSPSIACVVCRTKGEYMKITIS